jgi:hypothetical protein
MKYYFSKGYEGYLGSPFQDGFIVEYEKCINCGFVLSKTHREMEPHLWEKLNSSWHHYFEGSTTGHVVNQPPYAEQALDLTILFRNNILNLEDSLDYAAGYGTLSKLLKKYFDHNLKIYDPYVQVDNGLNNYVSNLSTYSLVINSAMFEHVISRSALDGINSCVKNDGVLCVHTRISEKIPNDPNWFYLTPHVHTAFHTNKSMEILMRQWGYAASIYSPSAKCWFLLKNKHPMLKMIERIIDDINSEVQAKHFYFKNSFVDFWKNF